MNDADRDYLREWYTQRYRLHGVSPKALGWDKGKQNIRFEVLTSQYDFEGKAVLDIGCGFGELIGTLNRRASGYAYTGIDLVEDFVREAQAIHKQTDRRFVCGDFLTYDFDEVADRPERPPFDYCVASGIFNHKFQTDNYAFIRRCMARALSLARDGLAFDFLSDRVDYTLEHTFHVNPMKVLEMAYSFSRNVLLRNDYMPFEFSLFIFKNDTFDKADTLFHRYKREQGVGPSREE